MKIHLEVVLEVLEGHTLAENAARREVVDAIVGRADAQESTDGPLRGVASVEVTVTRVEK